MSNYRKLYRSADGKMISGLCAGLGDYFNIDPTIIRVAWVLLAFLWGCGIVAYIIAWIIVPQKGNDIPGNVHYDDPK